MSKRSSSPTTHNNDDVINEQQQQHKRKRPNEDERSVSNSQAISTTVHSLNNQLSFLPHHQRKLKSNLAAPEVTLLGHDGAIYSLDFDPTGKFLCSASMDRNICKSSSSSLSFF